MQQVFGTDNHYIQDDGRGHEIIFVPFWAVNSGENTGAFCFFFRWSLNAGEFDHYS